MAEAKHSHVQKVRADTVTGSWNIHEAHGNMLQMGMGAVTLGMCLFSSTRLWVDTVNALSSCNSDGGDSGYTSEQLVEDPLLVLKCDPRVFW